MYNEDDDDRDITEITQRLSRGIDRLDVQKDVHKVKKENIPENTKTGGAEIPGELLLTLLGSRRRCCRSCRTSKILDDPRRT